MGAVLFLLSASILLAACSSIGAPSRAAECKAYVTCYERFGGVKGSLDSTYGSSGDCWTTTLEQTQICTATCIALNKKLIADHPDGGCVLR